MKHALLGLLWPLLTGFNVVRDPSNGGAMVWANPTVTYEIQRDGSDDITDGSDIEAIRASLQTWNQVGCSAFRFVDGGLGTSSSIGGDGVNRIAFTEANWPGGASGAAATTVREHSGGSPDRWTEADIRVNGVDFVWSTTGDVQRPDIQSVVTHELGHALGLSHSSNPEATMYFAARRGTTYARSLHSDDTKAVCWLYPTMSFSCQGDEDCPLYYALYGGNNGQSHCQAGACVAGARSDYAGACFGGGDCTSGICLVDPAMPPASEPGFCSQACTPGGAACPNGDFCGSVGGGPARCYPGRSDCIADADCGGMPRVCARDLDGRYRCLRLCLGDSVCFMTAGAVCHGGTGENPPGYCRVPGAGTPGTACLTGYECQSLACTAGGSNPSCAPGSPGLSDASVVTMDATSPADSGVHPDARPAPDAGPGADALPPLPDRGVVEPADAGAFPDAFAGFSDADEGAIFAENERFRGGCACLRPQGGPPVIALVLGGLWLAQRWGARRRRTSGAA